MGAFRIIKINNNVEVLSKILNSVAAKYDCQIKYDTQTRKVTSHCDESSKPLIINEVMGIFGVN